MPVHRVTPGEIVIISRSRQWSEKVIEGVVLDRGPTRLRVVAKDRPKDLRKGAWRLDRGANRVAHDRMHEALIAFHSTEGDGGTVLRDVLLATCSTSIKTPPSLRKFTDKRKARRGHRPPCTGSMIHRRLRSRPQCTNG